MEQSAEKEAQTLGSREVLDTLVLREAGIEPTFVTGLLQDDEGKRATSLRDGDRLAIQADNRSHGAEHRGTGDGLDAGHRR